MAEPLSVPVAVMVAAPPETPGWRQLACAVIDKAIRDLCLPPQSRLTSRELRVDAEPAPQREAAIFFTDPDSQLAFWAEAAGYSRELIVERVRRLHGARLDYWLAQPAHDTQGKDGNHGG